MAAGMIYEKNNRDKIIAVELARFGVMRKRIAKRLEICEETLETHYGVEMSNAKCDLHVEAGKNILCIGSNLDDPTNALKANTYILSKICRLETKVDDDKDENGSQALIRRALDALVSIKEAEKSY